MHVNGMPPTPPGSTAPGLNARVDETEATRKRLREGTLLAALRADPPVGVKLRSDEELEQSLASTLRSHDSRRDVHVFGYGSLMWNPALEYAQVLTARLQGWHRRFC